MKKNTQDTVELGELIQVVFDEAAQHSADALEVSHLATQAVADLLWRHTPKPKRPLPARICN